MSKRRLCLGGSFNPIHVGHLVCARAAAEAAGFAGVRLIPAGANPHKKAADLADASHRLTMCQLAVAGDPFFFVDDREIRRGGASYTFDTATSLLDSRAEPDHRVAWLIGTDLLGRLHTWHRFDELRKIVDFVVMRRAGQPAATIDLDPRVAAMAKTLVEVPQIEISSTDIRERVRAGKSIEHLVPPAVARLIANEGIYLSS